ncbi:hypothetical protein [Derxia lacustris]|uniref:hypothetical protein n=1 Tax=Derxia lacustris TaxID=764842 RepID=UPI001F3B5961|nr:hypothetical protein [Derxia lacustris]
MTPPPHDIRPAPAPDSIPPKRRRFALRENSWQERLAGFALMTAIVPLAVLGYLIICWVGFAGRTERGRAGVRALDHFVNAAVFNGLAWESVSSHAWRVRDRKRWARFVIWLTDRFQPGHCQRANKREQPVIDLVLKKGLEKRTIGAKDNRPD